MGANQLGDPSGAASPISIIRNDGSSELAGVDSSGSFYVSNGTTRIMKFGVGLGMSANNYLTWSNSANDVDQTKDTGMCRGGVGQVNVNDGSTTCTNYTNLRAATIQGTSFIGTPHTLSFTIPSGFTGQAFLGGQLATACTIIGWTLIGDVASGAVTVELDAQANSAPGAAAPLTLPDTTTDKISASAPMTISAAQSAAGGASAVSTWTTSRAAWDVYAVNVTTNTTFGSVSGSVRCQ